MRNYASAAVPMLLCESECKLSRFINTARALDSARWHHRRIAPSGCHHSAATYRLRGLHPSLACPARAQQSSTARAWLRSPTGRVRRRACRAQAWHGRGADLLRCIPDTAVTQVAETIVAIRRPPMSLHSVHHLTVRLEDAIAEQQGVQYK